MRGGGLSIWHVRERSAERCLHSGEHGWPLLGGQNAKDVNEGWICTGSRGPARAERKDGGEEGTPRENPPIYILTQCSWAEQDLAGRRCGSSLTKC